MTVSDFKALIASSNLNVVFYLATPTEVTLTASQVGQILSLKGVNNIFCDTGKVLSVFYSDDTKLYIVGKIAEAIANLS